MCRLLSLERGRGPTAADHRGFDDLAGPTTLPVREAEVLTRLAITRRCARTATD